MAKIVDMSVYTYIKLTDVIPLLSALVQVHTPHVSAAQVPPTPPDSNTNYEELDGDVNTDFLVTLKISLCLK